MDYNRYSDNLYGQSSYGVTMSYDQYLSRAFRWMAAGLLLTFAVACTVAYTNLFFMVQTL